MKVNVQYAREHFEELEAAVDRGEEVEIARESRSSLLLTPRIPSGLPVDRLELSPRVRLIGDWSNRPFLPENWNSTEVDQAIWEPFWNKLEQEAGLTAS